MLCEICNTREALVTYTEIINGQKKEQHLCESCAGKQTLALTGRLGADMSIESILSGILQKYAKGIAAKSANEPVCMRCGTTASELVKNGRVGCPGCYSAFSMILDKNLKTAQGALGHHGKVPHNAAKSDADALTPKLKSASDIMNETAEAIARKNNRKPSAAKGKKKEETIAEYRKGIEEAVRVEDYAEAARLRDLIKELEAKSQAKKPSKGGCADEK